MVLSRTERDALPAEAFAVPAKRQLPLVDRKHVAMARGQIGVVKGLTDEERSEARLTIRAKAEELGMDTSDWDTIASLRLEAMAIELPEIADHPNKMPFSGVLVHLDQESCAAPHGSKGKKIIMSANAAEEALGSLLGMAVDFTPNFDGHDAQRKIGVITAATIEGSDVHIEGFIYAADFPKEAATIKADKSALGFSFEAQQIHVESLDANPLVITACVFTGAAILKKDKAAFTTTSLAASAAGDIEMTKEEFAEMFAAGLKPVTDELAALKAGQTALDDKFAASQTKPTPEEVAAATAVLDKAGVKLAAAADEIKPDPKITALEASVADLTTKLADSIAASREKAPEPERKTISPQITAILAKAGVTEPEEGKKLTSADLDKALVGTSLQERMRTKAALGQAGLIN